MHAAYLIPSGGTNAQFRADLREYVRFAECMRVHGVPNFPDPATDPDGSPVFNLQHAGIDTQSPQVKTAALGCMSQLHLAKLPNYRVLAAAVASQAASGRLRWLVPAVRHRQHGRRPAAHSRSRKSRTRKRRRRIVSGTVSRDQPVPGGQPGFPGQEGVSPGPRGGRRRRGRWVALGIVVVVAAGAVSAWRAGVFSPAASSGSGQQGAPAPATAAVTRQDLVGNHAGDRDAGVRRVLHGDRAGRRDADLAAVGRAGDPPGAGAVQDRQRQPRWCCCTAACRPGGPWMRGSPAQDVTQLNHDLVRARLRRPRGYRRAGLGLLLVGDGVRGAAAGGAPGGLQPAGVAVAGAGGVRAGGAAGQPGDRRAWAARRPGRC